MARMKNGFLFNAIIALLVIVLVLILCVMVSTSRPSNNQSIPAATNGPFIDTPDLCNSNLVLEIMGRNNVSWNYSSYYYNTYPVQVVDSSDPYLKNGANYTMEIDEVMKGYWGITAGIAPGELVAGSIIRVSGHNDPNPDNYYFDGKTIKVYVEADPYNKTEWDNAWKQKITIIK